MKEQIQFIPPTLVEVDLHNNIEQCLERKNFDELQIKLNSTAKINKLST